MPEEFYTQKELVSFGNYLLSEKRKQSFEAKPNLAPIEERLKEVNSIDLERERWK